MKTTKILKITLLIIGIALILFLLIATVIAVKPDISCKNAACRNNPDSDLPTLNTEYNGSMKSFKAWNNETTISLEIENITTPPLKVYGRKNWVFIPENITFNNATLSVDVTLYEGVNLISTKTCETDDVVFKWTNNKGQFTYDLTCEKNLTNTQSKGKATNGKIITHPQKFSAIVVNSTNNTMSQCLLSINGTSDYCLVNGNKYEHTVNGTYQINVTGGSDTIQYTATNTKIDYNNTRITSNDTTATIKCLADAFATSLNHTVLNLACDSYREGVEVNGAIGNYNLTNINLTNIGKVASVANYVIFYSATNLTLDNVNIANSYGDMTPLIYLSQPDKIFINKLTITNSSPTEGEKPCIDPASGIITNTVLQNSIFNNSCANGKIIAGSFTTNNTLRNNQFESSGNNETTAAAITFTSGNNSVINNTFININLMRSWRTDIFNATYNGTSYDDLVVLANSNNLASTQITGSNQRIDAGINGQPADGTFNYTYCLISNSPTYGNISLLLKELGGTYAECAGITGAIGGTLDATFTNELIAPQGFSNYTSNNTNIWANITLQNPLRITYDKTTDWPVIESAACTTCKFENNTFYQDPSYTQLVGSLNFSGINTGTNVTNNNFIHAPVNDTEDAEKPSYCSPSGIGNFYTTILTLPTGDCGNTNSSTITTLTDNQRINITWSGADATLPLTYNFTLTRHNTILISKNLSNTDTIFNLSGYPEATSTNITINTYVTFNNTNITGKFFETNSTLNSTFQCGDDLKETHTMTRNFANSTAGTQCPAGAFTISTNNINLNCAGYAINYSKQLAARGISIKNADTAQIRNCNINQLNSIVNPAEALFLGNTKHNFINNTNITVEGDLSKALHLTNTTNTTINNSRMIVAGTSTSSVGIWMENVTENNSINKNYINVSGPSGGNVGLLIAEASHNTLSNNNITLQSPLSHALQITDSQNITSNNDTLYEPTDYIFTNTNVTIEIRNISLHHRNLMLNYELLNISNPASNVNTSRTFNFKFNHISVNGTDTPNFNTTANITFYNMTGYGSGKPHIEDDEDGRFVRCNSIRCPTYNYYASTNTYTFTVTGFSNYTIQDIGTPYGGAAGGGAGCAQGFYKASNGDCLPLEQNTTQPLTTTQQSIKQITYQEALNWIANIGKKIYPNNPTIGWTFFALLLYILLLAISIANKKAEKKFIGET